MQVEFKYVVATSITQVILGHTFFYSWAVFAWDRISTAKKDETSLFLIIFTQTDLKSKQVLIYY